MPYYTHVEQISVQMQWQQQSTKGDKNGLQERRVSLLSQVQQQLLQGWHQRQQEIIHRE